MHEFKISQFEIGIPDQIIEKCRWESSLECLFSKLKKYRVTFGGRGRIVCRVDPIVRGVAQPFRLGAAGTG